jgi:hypothetical protein
VVQVVVRQESLPRSPAVRPHPLCPPARGGAARLRSAEPRLLKARFVVTINYPQTANHAPSETPELGKCARGPCLAGLGRPFGTLPI